MENFKRITISIPIEIHEKAKRISKELLGKESMSGIFRFLINKYIRESHTPKNNL